MACKSKTAGLTAKRFKFSGLNSVALEKNMCETFDLILFKVIMGSFATLVSNWPVTRKVKKP